ncbi:hypothetical protein BDV25DRAFT_157398 [Aspergillus avenaceus]|uniref:Uncharacterized protein n=1 Tax=Aspergillus avenaceus TaxID=36643 RepID=A0A5N6TR60_ASPAV|nr:hypothetical protein BDV25DRAFT_157398 [Aspergillus avenaceus]
MHSFIIIFSIIQFFFTFSHAIPQQSISTDIYYWPVPSPEPSILARVSYDPKSLKINSTTYSPPGTTQDASLGPVRIGLYASGEVGLRQWTGTLTSWPSLMGHDEQNPMLRLHLDPSNEIYHATLASSSEPVVADPNLTFFPIEIGPRPHLNRPLVVGPDGINSDEVVEKTFFQKYWWVFLIITFLALSGSGEEQQ